MGVDPKVLQCPLCDQPRATHIHPEAFREMFPALSLADVSRRKQELQAAMEDDLRRHSALPRRD